MLVEKKNEPLQLYYAAIEKRVLTPDDSQKEIMLCLNDLFHRLIKREVYRKSLKGKLLELTCSRYSYVRGLYLWGGVGRGKTYLVDKFFDTLPFKEKLRLHFHRFMGRIHEGLKNYQGSKDPLHMVADELAQEARVICFDEFFVTDIADAMILAELIEAFFKKGITLVFTSNLAPKELYKDGLQRQRFLPFIESLTRYSQVVQLKDGVDYRYRSLKKMELFYFPLTDAAVMGASRCFEQFAIDEVKSDGYLTVNSRIIPYVKVAREAVWFDFSVICGVGRSQKDYLFLAREFHAVFITNIMVCSSQDDDLVRRFINLVDVFYDHGVKLVVTAETQPAGLYTGTRLAFEFKRTSSRLQEMQTQNYLKLQHRV